MNDFSWVAPMKAQLSKAMDHADNVRALQQTDGKPIQAITPFLTVNRPYYSGEVREKDRDLIFHFFPRGNVFPPSATAHMPFEEVMGDAFIEAFRFEDKIQAVYTEELKSWAVKVIGFSDNPAANMLCNKLFDVLDTRLKL